MKNQLVKVLSLCGIVVLSTPVLAGSDKYGDGKGPFMSFFDTNGDNLVTMEEFNAAAAKRFETMDVDKNGVVSTEEFQSFVMEKRKERHEQRFLSMDSNNDGQISQEEYISYKQQWAERRFQGMDTNNDGVVSKEEYEARKSRWSGHKHGRHGKDGIFAKLDADGDGQLTREESLTAWTNWFKRIDANGDQIVTADEVRDYRNKKIRSWK
ncbi:EF-hand domain-containing protein [Kaarinaea lacus]